MTLIDVVVSSCFQWRTLVMFNNDSWRSSKSLTPRRDKGMSALWHSGEQCNAVWAPISTITTRRHAYQDAILGILAKNGDNGLNPLIRDIVHIMGRE